MAVLKLQSTQDRFDQRKRDVRANTCVVVTIQIENHDSTEMVMLDPFGLKNKLSVRCNMF